MKEQRSHLHTFILESTIAKSQRGTFEKRAREQIKKRKSEEKQARRQARKDAPEVVDSSANDSGAIDDLVAPVEPPTGIVNQQGP